jgi:hypothetical protein
MSGLPPKRSTCRAARNVAMGHFQTHAPQQSLLGAGLHRVDRTSLRLAHLFDHIVGEREQLVRHVKGNRLRSLEVDHKLELGWLFHR